jgi:hypothetical protein
MSARFSAAEVEVRVIPAAEEEDEKQEPAAAEAEQDAATKPTQASQQSSANTDSKKQISDPVKIDLTIGVPEATNIVQQQPVAEPTAAKSEAEDELEQARRQWNEITKLREKQNLTRSFKVQEQSDPREVAVSYSEALVYFHSLDLSRQRDIVQQTYRAPNYNTFLRSVLHLAQKSLCYAFGTPLLKNAALEQDVEFILCVAKIAFDHENDLHARMLFTIYKRLTGNVELAVVSFLLASC